MFRWVLLGSACTAVQRFDSLISSRAARYSPLHLGGSINPIWQNALHRPSLEPLFRDQGVHQRHHARNYRAIAQRFVGIGDRTRLQLFAWSEADSVRLIDCRVGVIRWPSRADSTHVEKEMPPGEGSRGHSSKAIRAASIAEFRYWTVLRSAKIRRTTWKIAPGTPAYQSRGSDF
jgi:hypothetical protein